MTASLDGPRYRASQPIRMVLNGGVINMELTVQMRWLDIIFSVRTWGITFGLKYFGFDFGIDGWWAVMLPNGTWQKHRGEGAFAEWEWYPCDGRKERYTFRKALQEWGAITRF